MSTQQSVVPSHVNALFDYIGSLTVSRAKTQKRSAIAVDTFVNAVAIVKTLNLSREVIFFFSLL